jgi:hypothetical protein
MHELYSRDINTDKNFVGRRPPLEKMFRLAAAVTRAKERPGFPTNRLAACAPQTTRDLT